MIPEQSAYPTQPEPLTPAFILRLFLYFFIFHMIAGKLIIFRDVVFNGVFFILYPDCPDVQYINTSFSSNFLGVNSRLRRILPAISIFSLKSERR